MASSPACAFGGLYTAAELAAADQLVQLSGGSSPDDEVSSSSPRSVNTCTGAVWDEEEMGLGRRARKRYRLLPELYAATRPLKGAKKRKREELEMEIAMRVEVEAEEWGKEEP